MAALAGAAAAVVFGVGGALAVGTSDEGSTGPDPVPVESVPAGSSGGGEVSGGGDGGAGGLDGGGSVSGSGGRTAGA